MQAKPELKSIIHPDVFSLILREGGIDQIYYVSIEKKTLTNPLTYELYLNKNMDLIKKYDRMAMMCGKDIDRADIIVSDNMEFLLEKYLTGLKLLMHYNRDKQLLVCLVYK